MEIPEELKYTKEHEWCQVEDDIVTVGVTFHAQEQLGDIVYVELPEEGSSVLKDEAFGLVESPKAVSDLFSPVTGQVIEVNDPVADTPGLINDDPYEEGWLIRIQVVEFSELDDLLTAEEYKEYINEED